MGFEAMELYQAMPKNIRDTISHACVLNTCANSGLLHQARSIFNEINIKTKEIVITMVCFLTINNNRKVLIENKSVFIDLD